MFEIGPLKIPRKKLKTNPKPILQTVTFLVLAGNSPPPNMVVAVPLQAEPHTYRVLPATVYYRTGSVHYNSPVPRLSLLGLHQ